MPAEDRELEAATEEHRAGRLGTARGMNHSVLRRAPGLPVALFRCGLLELQDGQAAAALRLLEQASAVAPGEAHYEFVRAQALQALRRWDAAIEAYQLALKLQPQFVDAWNSLGMCRQMQGQLQQAAQDYRQALAIEPRNAGVIANLGTALREMGDYPAAVALLRDAAQLDPGSASHAVNLGVALWGQGEREQARRTLEQVAAQFPEDADAAFNLGNALHGLGNPREAAARYRQAVALRKGYADALINLGNVCAELGEFQSAQEAYRQALAAAPDSVIALNNSACLLRTLGRLDDAETLLRQAIALQPDNAALHDTLGNVLKDAGALEEAIEQFRRSLALNPRSAGTHSNLAYALSFQSSKPEAVLDECRRWSAQFAPQVKTRLPGRIGATPRRLRIGYVSPDFRVHCQSLFTIPVLSHHDRSQFEIYCYSSTKRADECTQRIAGYADQWREVRPLDDAALCRLIRDDEVDVLVDLTMHMAEGRPLLFAKRAAPVQIAWLAYPGTTGINNMDYRLSDPRLDPPGSDACYSEETLRLPDAFWCYDPLSEGLEVNELPALGNGYLTLGCLNNPCKLSDATLKLWGEVMRALADARLRLMAPAGRHRDILTERLTAHGIAAARVDYQPFEPRDSYLRSYHLIDIGLDTIPYNGHTTSLDSTWMGVPVATRVGETCVGRGGLSQLHQLGLTTLAAGSDAAFVAIVCSLAADLPALSRLRQGLRQRLQESALMDAARFARNLEQVYREVWQRQARIS